MTNSIDTTENEMNLKVVYVLYLGKNSDNKNVYHFLISDDEDKIWAIYFTPELKEYIYKNYPNEYIEDGEITGDDEYERIFIEGDNYIHCNKIVDFIDELLNMVPNPALRKK